MKTTETAVIDLRTKDAFLAGHHHLAASIPATELFQRMHELPIKNTALSVYFDQQSKAPSEAFFNEKNIKPTTWIEWNEEHQRALKQAEQFSQGENLLYYWQPSDVVKTFISMTETHNTMPRGKGVDFGCGAGRDSIYLAKQGWEMTGVDYNPDALARFDRLAAVHQVKNNAQSLSLHLESDTPQTLPWPNESLDLILVVRYLHRPLLNRFYDLLKPGGHLLYQTFMQGCETLGGPRNPNFLLKKNELSETFHQMTILSDQIITLDDGRPTNQFIAKKQ